MIKIRVSKKDNVINGIEIKGHAMQTEFGKDLVCAAITGISTGALNAIDQMEPSSCNFTIQEGLIIINVEKDSLILQTILQTVYYQLVTIYEQYKEFIDLKEVIK